MDLIPGPGCGDGEMLSMPGRHPAGGHQVPKESHELGLDRRLGAGQKALAA